MSPPKIIGLTGPAGSGKDLIAQMLGSKFGFNAVSFAGPLKREVAAAFNLNGDAVAWFEERENKERPMLRMALRECSDPGFIECCLGGAGLGGEQLHSELTSRRSYRWILQRWGTEYRRAQFPTYWIDHAADAIAGWDRVVFTDTRFPNEADFIRDHGGVLWHVKRQGIEAVETHVSNQELMPGPGDAPIFNDGTIKDLAVTIESTYGDYYASDRTGG